MCGLWLVRLPNASIAGWIRRRLKHCELNGRTAVEKHAAVRGQPAPTAVDEVLADPDSSLNVSKPTGTESDIKSGLSAQPPPGPSSGTDRNTSVSPTKPVSLYPASILGLAMVARGEIGFLISSLAETKGVFNTGEASSESKVFLIATWAIFLCTVIGPLSVGLLVRRVKRLEARAVIATRHGAGGRARDVLGVWGVH